MTVCDSVPWSWPRLLNPSLSGCRPDKVNPKPWFLFRRRKEKQLAHLTGHIARDRAPLRPRQRFVHVGAFQNPKSAHVLLGFGIWPIGDRHLAVRLLAQRLRVRRRRNTASEFPDAGSNHFAVERMN